MTTLTILWVLILNFILNEWILRYETSEVFFGDGLLFILFLNVFLASAISLLMSLFSEKIQKRITLFSVIFFGLIFYSQAIYDKLFRMYWTFYSLFHSAQVTEFMDTILITLANNWLLAVIFMLVMAVSMLLLKKAAPVNKKQSLITLGLSFILLLGFTVFTKDQSNSAYELTFLRPEIKATTYQTGLFSGMFTDALQSIGLYYPKDFEIEEVPLKLNDKTGLFKDKNLIFITAESFSTLALHEEYTPTLSRLAREGFQFENFYNPLWEVSTTDGEYAILSGLMPVSGLWSLSESASISMPYAMGSQFRDAGFKSRAFHNYNYEYYGRDKSHPNLGYEFVGVGNGLTVTDVWPTSDLELMRETVDSFIKDERFHTYYLTVSGHMLYDQSNAMAMKNIHQVKGPMREDYRHYLAANLELEKALQYLLERLEDERRLEDTVIALTGDHYPYALSDKSLIQTRSPMVYDSTFILYHPSIQGEKVEKVMGTNDILPTLLNLFGIPYDPSYYAGQDVFGDGGGFVPFLDRSVITDQGFFHAPTGKWQGQDLTSEELREILDERDYRINLSEWLLREDGYQNLSE